MPKNEQDKSKNGRPAVNGYLKYSGMAFQMVAIIGMFAYGGYLIDDHAHHSVRWVTALLSLAGVFISLYLVIKSIKE